MTLDTLVFVHPFLSRNAVNLSPVNVIFITSLVLFFLPQSLFYQRFYGMTKKLVKKSKRSLQLVKKASNIFGVRKLAETTKEVKLNW